jgi:two-component system invasion response regulator UvrY
MKHVMTGLEGAGNERSTSPETGAGPIPVLVVDDQESFRAVMREVVAATAGFRLVGEADSGEAALDAVSELAPQLVIMDKRMPGIGGIKACREITARHRGMLVLICSVEDPDPELARECGAARVVSKQRLSPRVLRELWLAQSVATT